MEVHLVDGTYELFRHYYGYAAGRGSPSGPAATRGVLSTVVSMLEDGATHVGVATDHVIESFRNDLWPGYKTGEQVPPELREQFGVLEDALAALGVAVWPMVELEADDALAAAAAMARDDRRVERVLVCTPDKDLAQCVVGERVVQVDRRRKVVVDERGVEEKFGVHPCSIPDWLALVGDTADGFPGIVGWGKRSASVVLAHYVHMEAIPENAGAWDPDVARTVGRAERLARELAAGRERADLFKVLATLRVDAEVTRTVDELAWRGPGEEFPTLAEAMGGAPLVARVASLAAR
ncbi:MAG TPA: 5'-3' exonuclease H3TH domain-containing protein [Acidimicrobiales bacterium]|nr:5'-3' exonuclease H3TH domain-containing protein [Acidimicrobiales bacterium]